MNNGFQIMECSDVDYEEMVVDILWENEPVAMLTQENGPQLLEITIYPSPGKDKSWNFPIKDFLETLERAKKHLERLYLSPEVDTSE